MSARRAVLFVFAISCVAARASLSVSPWMPLFKGVDHAVGTNEPDASTPIAVLQVVNVVRVDLADPDVRLFTDPRANNYAPESRETISLSTSNFLRNYGLQVGIDANFYSPGDPGSEGTSMEVFGLQISQGIVVSTPEPGSPDTASLLFTTNKQPFFVFNNVAPGTNTSRIYTAVTGRYPLIINGVSVANDSTSPIPNLQPRTACGASQDGRYLYLMTIDGRQQGYSVGALDSHTAYWLLLFGVYNAINMDGGGSTTLDMSDCVGSITGLNHPSYASAYGRERYVGSHFGVYAKPLSNFISNIAISPYDTTTTITWRTPLPATGQIEYGLTGNFGSLSASNSIPLRNHVVTLNGLTPTNIYFYRIISTVGSDVYSFACQFGTTNFPVADVTPVFGITQNWKYNSNNLDGVNWQARGYDDSSWAGPGPGCLFIESNFQVPYRNTGLPPHDGSSGTGEPVAPTFYFRTHFNFSNSPAGVSLIFTNYVDDGAVFYLNGAEIQRLRMTPAPAVITYTSVTYPSQAQPCTGDATCADIFTVSGSTVTNLVSGDNVLAVEVHQADARSADIVFGSALSYNHSIIARPKLNILREGTTVTIYWAGSGFILQQATDPTGLWTDVPGPVTKSTYVLNSSDGLKFYRLRN